MKKLVIKLSENPLPVYVEGEDARRLFDNAYNFMLTKAGPMVHCCTFRLSRDLV